MTGIPLTRYRPQRVSDGKGGFPETLGTGVTVFGLIAAHANEEALIVDRQEDVVNSDVLAVAEESNADQQFAFYRVTSANFVPRGRFRRLNVERIARPVFPARPRYVLLNGARVLFGGSFVTLP